MPVYCTGISQPAKGMILPPIATWLSYKGVRRKEVSDMPFRVALDEAMSKLPSFLLPAHAAEGVVIDEIPLHTAEAVTVIELHTDIEIHGNDRSIRGGE